MTSADDVATRDRSVTRPNELEQGWPSWHAESLEAARRVAVAKTDSSDLGLANELYRGWYACPGRETPTPDPWDAPMSGTLRAAHAGGRRWTSTPATVVQAGLAGVAVIEEPAGTGRRRRALCRGEYVTASGAPGTSPEKGDELRSLERRGGLVVEGWWRTWSAPWQSLPREDDVIVAPLSRLYIAPRGGQEARITAALTTLLEQIGGAWCLKLPAERTQLVRPDAIVVYVPSATVTALAEAVLSALAGRTHGRPPPLTAPLAEGIGWAEDPGTGFSFGEQRCDLIAQAFNRLSPSARADRGAFLQAIAAAFVDAGFDPGKPHLRRRAP